MKTIVIDDWDNEVQIKTYFKGVDHGWCVHEGSSFQRESPIICGWTEEEAIDNFVDWRQSDNPDESNFEENWPPLEQ